MLYLGLIICLISAGFFAYGRICAIKARCDEYSAVCALLLHIRGKLASGGGALCEILRDFRSDRLEGNGTLRLLGRGDAAAAFLNGEPLFRDKLSLSHLLCDKGDSEKLSEYFSLFGKSYIDEERKKLDGIIGYFEKRTASVTEKGEKDIKVTMVLFAFFSVGAFILIM